MNPTTIGLLRHALTAGGAILVARGYVPADQVPELVDQVMIGAGAVMTTISVGSFLVGRYQAWRAAKAS